MSEPIPPCFDCADAPTERLIEMFVGIVQEGLGLDETAEALRIIPRR